MFISHFKKRWTDIQARPHTMISQNTLEIDSMKHLFMFSSWLVSCYNQLPSTLKYGIIQNSLRFYFAFVTRYIHKLRKDQMPYEKGIKSKYTSFSNLAFEVLMICAFSKFHTLRNVHLTFQQKVNRYLN